jgi:heme-degrading monooxygenase HmoA
MADPGAQFAGGGSSQASQARGAIRYVVIAWADPEIADELAEWLRDTHLAEVIARPGFIDGEVVALEERSPEGKVGVMSIYTVESLDAFRAYQESSSQQRYTGASRFTNRIAISKYWGSPFAWQERPPER